MKVRGIKILCLVLSLLVLGQTSARADFVGPFAPSNWTFSGTATSNSLTPTQMQIESANIGGGLKTANYSIGVPGNTLSITFNYHYITRDVDGSSFDLAKYSVDGIVVNMVSSSIPDGGTETGTITLTNIAGKSLAIIQEALDGILGSATITITGFSAAYKIGDYLMVVDSPKLDVKNGLATCSSGTYKFASGSKVVASALAYTLFINNQPVSRVAYDPAGALAPHMFSSITHTVSGVASTDQAIWDVSKLTNYEARCEVTATSTGTMTSTPSNVMQDEAKVAAALTKEDWEVQRALAVVANNTKKAQEFRKRIAARQP